MHNRYLIYKRKKEKNFKQNEQENLLTKNFKK